jgi:transposase InsO family protein
VLRRLVEPGQYTSIAFGRKFRESGIAASMGSIGDCYDKAYATDCTSLAVSGDESSREAVIRWRFRYAF